MKNQEFDFSIDVLQVLLWQYNRAENLTALLQAKQDWLNENHEQFWTNWVRDVFDLRTANEFGCSVWAVILNLPLAVVQPPAPQKRSFGFGPYNPNFNRSNFGATAQQVLPLTLEQKRLVLQLRYFQLITRGTVLAVNKYLKRVFAALGPVYMIDNHDMTITYHFGFVLPSALSFVLTYYDLLPRPSGVAVNYMTP